MWSEKMIACLKVDGLAAHIHPKAEEFAKKAEDPLQWELKDDQAHSRILLCVEDKLIAVVRRMSARQAWVKLQQMFESRNVDNIVTTIMGYLTNKQQDVATLPAFLAEQRRRWDLIEEMMQMKDFKDKLRMTGILMNLPDSLKAAVDVIQLQGTGNLTTDQLEEYLLNEVHRQQAWDSRAAIKTDDSGMKQVDANALTSSQTRPNKEQVQLNVCPHCNRRGRHKPEACWELAKNAHLRPSSSLKHARKEKNVPQDDTTALFAAFINSLDLAEKTKLINSLGGASTYSTVPESDRTKHIVGGVNSAYTLSETSSASWIIDSGASDHITGDRKLFDTYQQIKPINLLTADNRTVQAVGRGSVRLTLPDSSEVITLENVLHAPGFKKHLLSIGQELKKGYHVLFAQDGGVYYLDPKTVPHLAARRGALSLGTRVGTLFYSNGSSQKPSTIGTHHIGNNQEEDPPAHNHNPKSVTIWHRRLGHLNIPDIRKLAKVAEGIQINHDDATFCSGCILGKLTRRKFPKKATRRASRPLELVHSDVGVVNTLSLGGHRYYVVFVDDHTRRTFLYLMKTKDEVITHLDTFVRLAERQTGRKLQKIRSDRGGEYCSEAMKKYCQARGIVHELTAPYSPAQNGVAERKQRTLVESARCMLHAAKLPLSFWGEALKTATHLGNLHPTSALNKDNTPYKMWEGKNPDLSHLRVFGCQAYGLIPDQQRTKMEAKAKHYVFVGYADHSKAYRLYDPETNRIIERRDVAFNENQNGYVETPPSSEEVDILFEILNEDQEATPAPGEVLETGVAETDISGPGNLDNNEEERFPYAGDDDEDEEEEKPPPQNAHHTPPMSENLTPDPLPLLEDSIQSRIDSQVLPAEGEGSRSPPTAIQPSRIPLLRSRLQQEDSISRAINNTEKTSDPRTIKEALSGPQAEEWSTAVASELASMEQHNVWELVERPPDANVIGCKWVFRTKYNSDGSLDRYKARLVAQGYNQKFGVDYNEVFAPVVSYESVRCLLSLAATYDLEIHHVDIKTAFLHGDLEETIYMRQPPGFEHPGAKKSMVCKLKRSIYGLKQSPRQWNKVLDGYLRDHGFEPSLCEPCVYIRKSEDGSKPTIISAFVDDTLIFAPDPTKVIQVKQLLANRFEVTDLGELQYFLGVEVLRDRPNRKIYLRQTRYIQDILKKFRMEESNPTGTPAVAGEYLPMACELPPLSPADEQELLQIPYRNAVGALLHLMVATRPDIAYAVQSVSQHMANYRNVHWKAVKRIFRYLKGTSNYALCLGGSDGHNLKLFADADWANDTFSRKSVTGYFMTLGTGAFAWKCKKQDIVSSSTTEAECISLWTGSKHAEHITFFLTEISYPQAGAVEAFQDNKSTITICQMPRPKSKYVDVKHCVVRDKVNRNILRITYCPSKDMTADILTKALPAPLFQALLPQLGIVPNTTT